MSTPKAAVRSRRIRRDGTEPLQVLAFLLEGMQAANQRTAAALRDEGHIDEEIDAHLGAWWSLLGREALSQAAAEAAALCGCTEEDLREALGQAAAEAATWHRRVDEGGRS